MRITWLILDDNADPVTDKSSYTSIKVRRLSDGFLFDWNDGLFKASGWTTISVIMAEVDAVNLEGWYEKVVAESSWSDGAYQIITSFDDGVIKRYGNAETIIRDGSEVLNLSSEEVIRALWSRAIVNKDTGDFTVYKLDKVTPLITGVINVTDAQSERVPD